MNIGHSSLLIYDECAYNDRLREMTDPIKYKISPHQIHNCRQCLSTLGPRSSYMGQGVSTHADHPVATSQYLTDVESVLTNRNIPSSKCCIGGSNPIDVTKIKNIHLPKCNRFLDPMSSRLSYPPFNYRGIAINRFYTLPQNPQEPIFYDFATNTKLEAKDNYVFRLNKLKTNDPTYPEEKKDSSSYRVPIYIHNRNEIYT